MEVLFPARLKVLLLVLMFQVLPSAAEMPSPSSGCRLSTDIRMNYFSDGDLIIGGILQIHDIYISSHPIFYGMKEADCRSYLWTKYDYPLIFIYSIGEINRNPEILPNVTLGYRIYDSCGSGMKSFASAFGILSGTEQPIPNYSCWNNRKISYGSADPIFNNRQEFPSFYRMIPNELNEIDAIMSLIRHFGWKWVGLVVSDDDTGHMVINRLEKVMSKDGVCLAFRFTMKRRCLSNKADIKTIREQIYRSTAKVVILFSSSKYFTCIGILYESKKLPKIWIATSSFFHSVELQHLRVLFPFNGTLVLSFQQGEAPSFKQFFRSINPFKYQRDVLFTKIWETLFFCTFSETAPREGTSINKCTGNESFDDSNLPSYETFNFRTSLQIYTAVYTMAHTLHELYGTMTRSPKSAESLHMYFKQWQFVHSRCSEPCKPGFSKAKVEGAPSCCYTCVLCADGEMSNITDAQSCMKCSKYAKSNVGRNGCIPRNINYLSYGDQLGSTLSSISVILSVTCAVILGIFIKYRETPIVRANNRYLSCLLLISLMLCFLCTLLFIGRPTQICCLLRQVTFGIVFTISVSSVLAKTLTVIIAFNATKPGSKLKKYVGTQLAIILVIVCSLVEIVISSVWLASNPPFPEADTLSDPDYIILMCNEGSDFFFFCIIGYIGTLALLSFIAAFLAKDFPDRFNEAKNITFSMLGFCSVWGAFVPAYLSSKGSRMVAVEIFAILSSSAGLLGCIFIPKCYILFLRPELNTKANVIRK
uniref:G-protein coupled receptors family 3 profile domain-containing protein n=1 Tax=Xenopus tropicalis TaxID=8364 RepID=A0A1B8Y823_XENTR